MQYTEDNEECMPYSAWNNNVPLGLHPVDATYPYTKSIAIWRCPDMTSKYLDIPNLNGENYSLWANSATFNNHAGDHIAYSWDEFGAGQALAACSNPSSTFMLMDKGNNVTWTTGGVDWVSRVQEAIDDSDNTKPGPHTAGKNIAFVDGHVKYFKSTAIKAKDAVDPLGVDPNSPNYANFKN